VYCERSFAETAPKNSQNDRLYALIHSFIVKSTKQTCMQKTQKLQVQQPTRNTQSRPYRYYTPFPARCCHVVSQFETLLTSVCRCVKSYCPCRVTWSTGNESVPIQLAQCRFPQLAISNAKMLMYFSNKVYGSNFIKQHSETVMV